VTEGVFVEAVVAVQSLRLCRGEECFDLAYTNGLIALQYPSIITPSLAIMGVRHPPLLLFVDASNTSRISR
jgi:hypothetical protein